MIAGWPIQARFWLEWAFCYYPIVFMRRIFIIGLCLSLLSVPSLCAANPGDVDFRLALVKDSSSYHLGEPIEFEISYSSQSPAKYRASWSSPIPQLESVTFNLTPADGAIDMRVVRQSRAFGGSFLSSESDLESEPRKQTINISDWYHFQKPGHYSLTATSHIVWRVKSADEGGGRDPLTLTSNIVEFEILPADASWESQELNDTVHELDTTQDIDKRIRAIGRLALLDTPQSVSKLIEMYLSNADPGDGYQCYQALIESSHTDLIVPIVEAAWVNANSNPPEMTAELLAELRVKQKLGVMPARPTDEEGLKKWNAESDQRAQIHNAYFAEANAAFLASLGRRSGADRAQAVYTLLDNNERLAVSMRLSPDVLNQLRYELLNSSQLLDPVQKMHFVVQSWDQLPHDHLLPLIKELATGEDTNYTDQAFELWCKGWASDCNTAILTATLKPGNRIDRNVPLLLREAEHPELDKIFQDSLDRGELLQDYHDSQRIAALILRVGSRNLSGSVDAVLDRLVAGRSYACEIDGYLLGYLFRVDPKDAAKRMSAQIQTQDRCGDQIFRVLNTARYSDDLIPIAILALNSPDLSIAGTAALFLGERGPASTQDALWQRLNVFWKAWHGREKELLVQAGFNDVRTKNTDFEWKLVSALTYAKRWTLSEPDRTNLRDHCITDQCRDIVDKKMSVSL
jgi:hypothetical protein